MINFRDFEAQDKLEYIEMSRIFYADDVTLYPITEGALDRTFEEVLKGNPFLRGIIIEYDKKTAGYVNLSFTYSNEADGIVVFIEEVYVKPEFQGKGLGTAAFNYIRNQYDGKVKRYRLEVCHSNTGAIKLYEKLGFGNLDYKQMILDV